MTYTNTGLKDWTPVYHFTAPEFNHYPFDPNGAVFYKGEYHLFYLYQADWASGRNCCWGHAVSKDLVSWRFEPAALLCDQEGDEVAVFSGCLILDKAGLPVIVYHSLGKGTALARPTDDTLRYWVKDAANPVIRQLPDNAPEQQVVNVFDPFVWREGKWYYVILGARTKPFMERDTCYLYRSQDLYDWEYLRPFYQSSARFTEVYEDMACPEFFELDGQKVLLGISHAHGARAYVGEYLMNTFVIKKHQRLNGKGGSFFAPESCVDDRNRRVAWFWMVNQLFASDGPRGYDFREMLALPRVLNVNADGVLCQSVPEEFKQLEELQETLSSKTLEHDKWLEPAFKARQGKLKVKVQAQDGRFVVRLFEAPEQAEYAEVFYDFDSGVLGVDSEKCGDPAVATPREIVIPAWDDVGPREICRCQTLPCETARDGELTLEIYWDNSIIEVFANAGETVVSQLVYPRYLESAGIRLGFTTSGEIVSGELYAMKEAKFI